MFKWKIGLDHGGFVGKLKILTNETKSYSSHKYAMDEQYHSIDEYAMNKQFFLLILIVNIIHQYATNKQVIQISITFVFFIYAFTGIFFMRYIIHLHLVLGNWTQVHLQCTWVVPKYISQNPVLVLEHFQCTCTQYGVNVLAPTLLYSYSYITRFIFLT